MHKQQMLALQGALMRMLIRIHLEAEFDIHKPARRSVAAQRAAALASSRSYLDTNKSFETKPAAQHCRDQTVTA